MYSAYGLCFNRTKDNLRFDIPDGSNIGPILPSLDGNTRLEAIKNIGRKFSYSYSSPTIPLYCNSVNSSFEANDYSNSNKSQIKVFSMEDNNYIAYCRPSLSNSLSTFMVSEICKKKTESYVLQKTQDAHTSKLYAGIDISVYDNEAFALLLGADEFDIVKVPSMKPVIKSQTKRKIADASLHKMLKNYFTIIENEGTIHVFNCDRKVPCWSKYLAQKSTEQNYFLSCQFGYHPLSVLVTCSENIFSLDTRMGTNSGNSLVFSLSNIGSSFEQKICSVAFKQNPYMYVNCTNTVYLIDERYVKGPIVSWNHLLPSLPNYSDLMSINSENILVLGNATDKQVCFIPTKANEFGNELNYIPDTCLPYHFYTIEDTISIANANDMWYHSAIKERFSSQCMGFTVDSSQNDEFCLWTQNVFGDLMYQIYKPGTKKEHFNFDCRAEEKHLFKNYEESILNNFKQKESLRYCKISNPCVVVLKNNVNRWNKSIVLSKDRKQIFWRTQDIVVGKRKTLSGRLPLLSEYKTQKINSRSEYIQQFLNVNKSGNNFLDNNSSNSLKNKLISTWRDKMQKDMFNSMNRDSSTISKDEISPIPSENFYSMPKDAYELLEECDIFLSSQEKSNSMQNYESGSLIKEDSSLSKEDSNLLPIHDYSEASMGIHSNNISFIQDDDEMTNICNILSSFKEQENIDVKEIEVEDHEIFLPNILESKNKRKSGF